MSLLDEFIKFQHIISSDMKISSYTNNWIEAYLPTTGKKDGKIPTKLKALASKLEEVYNRPVQIYVNESRCLIKLS